MKSRARRSIERPSSSSSPHPAARSPQPAASSQQPAASSQQPAVCASSSGSDGIIIIIISGGGGQQKTVATEAKAATAATEAKKRAQIAHRAPSVTPNAGSNKRVGSREPPPSTRLAVPCRIPFGRRKPGSGGLARGTLALKKSTRTQQGGGKRSSASHAIPCCGPARRVSQLRQNHLLSQIRETTKAVVFGCVFGCVSCILQMSCILQVERQRQRSPSKILEVHAQGKVCKQLRSQT